MMGNKVSLSFLAISRMLIPKINVTKPENPQFSRKSGYKIWLSCVIVFCRFWQNEWTFVNFFSGFQFIFIVLLSSM